MQKVLTKEKIKNLLKDILDSIKGTEQNYTEGNIKKALLLLSIPMVLEMIMESVFAVVDIAFVSRLGADAISTVGITESIMTLVYAIGIGLSVATTAIVSRRIGEKKAKKASISAVHAIYAGIAASFIISIPGFFYSKEILNLMGASVEMIHGGYEYTLIMLSGNIVIMLLFIINAVFRSSGDAAISMKVLALANLINIVLDPLFIFGYGPFPELGIMGAAVATNIGRSIAVMYQFYILFVGNQRIKIKLVHLKFKFKELYKIVKLSFGGIAQSIIATSSWIGLFRILAEFGSNVLAGYTLAIRIIIFVLLPSWGLSNAAETLVGQNLGAKKPERAESSVWIAALANMIFLSVLSLFFIIFPDFFLGLLSSDTEIIKHGTVALRIVSIGFISYALGMVIIQSFNGAGDTNTPTLINLLAFWFIEIPLAYFLALNTNLDEKGVYFAILISETFMTIFSIILFKRGKWKHVKV
ncbi:MAG: MATE family efflux transporter [Bacteroidales bacterium]|nr:MATE family efflux transporter [Bacteroidales bacterium]MBN2758641.1 MATE family efflux transporter [Bacteroidales bacterium]